MSEDKDLAEHVATLPSEAERDAKVARTVSGVRCSDCAFRSPDVELAANPCPKCDHGYMQTIARTELRAKECARCGEQFLWRFDYGLAEVAKGWQHGSNVASRAMTGPDNCRACEEEAGAAYKYQAAKKQYEKAKKVRAEQRAAVARFKPKDNAR